MGLLSVHELRTLSRCLSRMGRVMSCWCRPRPTLWSGVLALTIYALAGCGHRSRPEAQVVLPPDPPTVQVRMVEYRLIYRSSAIPAGRVVFRVVNDGRVMHELTLLRLPRDLPPINKQLHGHKRRILPPFAGVPDLQPGQADTFAVDLTAGQRYALICFDIAPDGQSDALNGMASEFRPGARRSDLGGST